MQKDTSFATLNSVVKWLGADEWFVPWFAAECKERACPREGECDTD